NLVRQDSRPAWFPIDLLGWLYATTLAATAAPRSPAHRTGRPTSSALEAHRLSSHAKPFRSYRAVLRPLAPASAHQIPARYQRHLRPQPELGLASGLHHMHMHRLARITLVRVEEEPMAII